MHQQLAQKDMFHKAVPSCIDYIFWVLIVKCLKCLCPITRKGPKHWKSFQNYQEHLDTLGCQNQYTAPNNHWRWVPPPPQMQVSAPYKCRWVHPPLKTLIWKNWSQRWSLYLLWWTNQTLIFDFDTRVKVNQFVRKIDFKIKILCKFKNYTFGITLTSPRGQWVNFCIPFTELVANVAGAGMIFLSLSWWSSCTNVPSSRPTTTCFPFRLQHTEEKIDTFRLGQNSYYFADIFKSIFLNENFYTLIRICLALKFVPSGISNQQLM